MAFNDEIYEREAREYPYTPPPPGNLNLNLNLDFNPELKNPSDWLTPPPTWSPLESPLTDLHSPISSTPSAGVYQDVTWNPFDYSFASVQSRIDNGVFTSTNPFSNPGQGPIASQNEYIAPNENAYVSLSSIHESPHMDFTIENETQDLENSQQVTGTFQASTQHMSPLLSPNLTLPTRTRQPAWGQPRSRGSSISTSTSHSMSHAHKRRKSTGTAIQSQSQSQFTARLRSTSSNTSSTSTYRPSTSSPSSGTISIKEERGSKERGGGGSKTRSNHNQVEKQYRNRLNSQFEVLLSILPKEELPAPPSSSSVPGIRDVGVGVGVEDGRGDNGGGGGGGEARRVSKAEVLVLAKRYIRRLERDGMELEGENRALRERVSDLKRVWIEGGGVVMP